jgi:hypothetical protein
MVDKSRDLNKIEKILKMKLTKIQCMKPKDEKDKSILFSYYPSNSLLCELLVL